jgi:hypothetical protein
LVWVVFWGCDPPRDGRSRRRTRPPLADGPRYRNGRCCGCRAHRHRDHRRQSRRRASRVARSPRCGCDCDSAHRENRADGVAPEPNRRGRRRRTLPPMGHPSWNWRQARCRLRGCRRPGHRRDRRPAFPPEEQILPSVWWSARRGQSCRGRPLRSSSLMTHALPRARGGSPEAGVPARRHPPHVRSTGAAERSGGPLRPGRTAQRVRPA